MPCIDDTNHSHYHRYQLSFILFRWLWSQRRFMPEILFSVSDNK